MEKPAIAHIQILKKIASKNATSRAVFKEFMNRQRACRGPHYNIEIPRFKHAIENKPRFDIKDYEAVFKDLEAAGYGKIVYRRNGKVDVRGTAYFQFFYHIKTLGVCGLGGKAKPLPLKTDKALKKEADDLNSGKSEEKPAAVQDTGARMPNGDRIMVVVNGVELTYAQFEKVKSAFGMNQAS